MKFDNVYFITGTAYAGKSTMVKLLAEKYSGIACEENYHDALLPELDKEEFPCLTYTRDLEDWHDFIRRTPEVYDTFKNSGFNVILRDEKRTIDETLKLVENAMKLA